MPSRQDVQAATGPVPIPLPPAQAQASPAVLSPHPQRAAAMERQQAQCLAEASRALWLATLSLMTAFMQTPAPAHRYLLARRISRNLDTLSRQDCFDAGCRARFDRLARRWQSRAEPYAPEGSRPAGGLTRLFS